ncbi:MAG: histidinol-phosphatase [Rhodospirillaceae bacterium]
MNVKDKDALMTLALQMAAVARDIVLRHYGGLEGYEDKADGSPVTAADREVEAAMRKQIEDRFPGHGIYGEEYGAERADADFVWVLDPIDGTKSFVSGKPMFGTLIGLLREGKPWIGVMDTPVLGETWAGGPGMPATCNGKPAKSRPCKDLSRAWLHCTSPGMHRGVAFDRFTRLSHACKQTVYGGDCYAYAVVAKGRGDVTCENSMSPYDYVALVPIIESAGGRMTDWGGNVLGLNNDGSVLAAGDPAVHEQAMDVLRA